MYQKGLRKIETEIYFLNAAPEKTQEFQEKLGRAKQRLFTDFMEFEKGKALCPFHDDHHPSFSVRHNRGRCFACSWHGDIIDYMQQRHNMTFRDAVERLAI